MIAYHTELVAASWLLFGHMCLVVQRIVQKNRLALWVELILHWVWTGTRLLLIRLCAHLLHGHRSNERLVHLLVHLHLLNSLRLIERLLLRRLVHLVRIHLLLAGLDLLGHHHVRLLLVHVRLI